ncbi:hypothetical protein FRB98_007530 [Tulasnella sp. 332]|nr:hypothetical protein FRB98_007530 [Tulasnella sp. 332]
MYVLYGQNLTIVVLPIILLLILFAFTLILTVMRFRRSSFEGPYRVMYIAFGIWWVGRDAVSPRARSRYKSIALALVESGAMYSVTILIGAPFTVISGQVGTSSFITYIYTMVVAVTPMLIIFLLNQSSSQSSPGSALGEGVDPMYRVSSSSLLFAQLDDKSIASSPPIFRSSRSPLQQIQQTLATPMLPSDTSEDQGT